MGLGDGEWGNMYGVAGQGGLRGLIVRRGVVQLSQGKPVVIRVSGLCMCVCVL